MCVCILSSIECACVCAELLTQASRQIMIEMVSIVFKGLADIPDVPMTPTTARSLADLAHSPRLQYSPDSAQGPLLSPFLGGGTVASTAGDSLPGAVVIPQVSGLFSSGLEKQENPSMLHSVHLLPLALFHIRSL